MVDLHQDEREEYSLVQTKGCYNTRRISQGVEQSAMERRDIGEYGNHGEEVSYRGHVSSETRDFVGELAFFYWVTVFY